MVAASKSVAGAVEEIKNILRAKKGVRLYLQRKMIFYLKLILMNLPFS
jgi:hypothetical protein